MTAAAPHATPQMSGTHVPGFVSCSRIFQLRKDEPSSAAAPLSPSSCLRVAREKAAHARCGGCGAFGVAPHRKFPLPSVASALVSAAFGSLFSSIAIFHARRESAGRVARPAAAGALKPAHEQARARRSTIWRAMLMSASSVGSSEGVE